LSELLSLAQAGPVAILLVGIVALYRAFLSEIPAAVPGYLYRRERADREKAELRVVELTKALADLAKVAANGAVVPGAPSG
jgi:hypothetical protein